MREWVDPASRLRTAIASRITRGRDEALDGPGTIKPFRWLAFGGVYVAMMLTMAVSMARRTRQIAVDGPAAVAEQRYRRVNVLVPVLVGYGMAIQLSAATVASIPAFGDALSGRAGFGLLPLMLFNFGVTFWMFRVGQGGQRPVAPAARQERFGATPHPTTRGSSAACCISTRATRPCGSRAVSALATH